jgi:hypothetical protein
MSSLLLVLACTQDLIERDYALRRRLPPGVDFSEVKPRRASIEIDAAADFACGKFDLKASLRSLFDKNVKEEFLGGALQAIEAELAGSALVLACYASPTVCDALKHYRVSANAMLGMEYDACRTVEQALEDTERRSQARAIKECLDEKARQGVPLDEAQRACQGARQVRGLDGRAVREINLTRDLGISDSLVAGLQVGAGTYRAEARATAVVEAYETKRQAGIRAWEAAVANPSSASLADLGPVSRAEVDRVAAMDAARRDAVIRSAAAAKALADLVREAHEAERALEGAELVASPEVRGELERRRLQLRNEIARLVETFEAERRLHAALTDAEAAASADVAARARERLAPRRASEAESAASERLKPWGCEVKRETKERRSP